jgi:hypothetical protein
MEIFSHILPNKKLNIPNKKCPEQVFYASVLNNE